MKRPVPASLPLSEVFAIVSFPCLFRGACEDLSKAFVFDFRFGQSVILTFGNCYADISKNDKMAGFMFKFRENWSKNTNKIVK